MGAGGYHALLFACLMGHLPVVRLLMHRGANVILPNHKGHTPLMAASKNDHPQVVRLLLQGRAQVNRSDTAFRDGEPDGMTPLLYACAYGAEECVEILVQNGADVDARNSRGESPLDHAKKNNDAHAILVLEEAKSS